MCYSSYSSLQPLAASSPNRPPLPPPSSPTLTFEVPPQIFTCKSSTFSWDYSGPDLRMSLYITNIGVTQLDPPSSPSPSSTTTKPLGRVQLWTIALSTFEGLAPVHDTNYTWSSVWTPRGWWILEADLRQYLFGIEQAFGLTTT
ncbi:hypothetical protein BDZ94DRAFT_1240399 [Collybia nuda]|uniref:Uncharacterized protein n=1 Tax=Collybia nuda TaxID=64659 RepID=A0A9P6CEG0_9AGAR|nr:hypothetical protein BDZ94DRAFT_1240399 [Collybia nuda]